ncbi:MAG: chloride channel protein [Chitinophagales bacterium]|nr:chloride channel protein [Chitinophagales bacterium]
MFKKFILTLKQYAKIGLEQINNHKLRNNILHAIPFWFGAFICGIVAVMYAKLFEWVEDFSLILFQHNHAVFFIISPLAFVLAWWVVKQWAPYARGSGIPQVTAAIELNNKKEKEKVNHLLSLRISLVKILSSLLLIFGGGVIGREGPTIQVSASIFRKINDVLPKWYPKISRSYMIITGAAAGLAAAFNTPLGGIVFAIEELTKTHFNYFKSALLTGVIIAGITALGILGPYLYIGDPQFSKYSFTIVVPVIALAIITGFLGSIMGELILKALEWRKKYFNNWQNVLFLLGSGLILASFAYFLSPTLLGSGKEIIINKLFATEKEMVWYIPLLRILGSVLSFSSGAAGGIFAPSLSAGASVGTVFAQSLHLTPGESNLLILCGMTGFLTSITRSPFTACILVIEMTNSHIIIFYIMFTALISNLVAVTISSKSFYDKLKAQYIQELNVPHEKNT